MLMIGITTTVGCVSVRAMEIQEGAHNFYSKRFQFIVLSSLLFFVHGIRHCRHVIVSTSLRQKQSRKCNMRLNFKKDTERINKERKDEQMHD